MGVFRRNSAPLVPSPAEPVRTREELTAITRAQEAQRNPLDPQVGPPQSDGRLERVEGY